MLSPDTIAIVKATAPVLAEQGETLTRHFYKRMFRENPEVAPFFNPAHQKAGKQQRALAGAITAYAAHIDNLDVLGGAVELIAQKHASLMIKPEHYPIVGANLLASIREVLGEAATEEVIDAWAQAYGFLADILIGRERQIYEMQAHQPGGWEGFRRFRVLHKERESDVISSFYLVPEDGGELPHYKAGQYITLRIPTAEGGTTLRNYSLSDRPGQGWFRISVKREDAPDTAVPAGYVSTLLHEQVAEGHVLELAPPSGEFFLDEQEQHTRPLVLLAAGIGITPLMSILLTALETQPQRQIIFMHGCLNPAVQAFRRHLDELAQEHRNLHVHHRYSHVDEAAIAGLDNSSVGFMDGAWVESLLPTRDADYYFCGPQPFMVAVYHELLRWGIPASQVHFEFFGPREELDAA